MRFGLRMLLIVVTLIGGPFARIGYLHQRARFHRQLVEKLVPALCASDRATPDEVRMYVSFMATDATRLKSRTLGRPYIIGIGSTEVIEVASDAGRGHIIQDEATLREWREAFAHEIIARRFDRATLRPWQTVDDNLARINQE
jgi:hypothetical protein